MQRERSKEGRNPKLTSIRRAVTASLILLLSFWQRRLRAVVPKRVLSECRPREREEEKLARGRGVTCRRWEEEGEGKSESGFVRAESVSAPCFQGLFFFLSLPRDPGLCTYIREFVIHCYTTTTRYGCAGRKKGRRARTSKSSNLVRRSSRSTSTSASYIRFLPTSASVFTSEDSSS